MSYSILNLTDEPEMLSDFIQTLHQCVETEYTSMSIFGSENGTTFLELMTNINSNCLFSMETVRLVVDKYQTGEDFRRIWGSIGANVECIIKLKYGNKNLSVFVEAFLAAQEVAQSEAQKSSFTVPDLITHRVNSRQTLVADFHHPADFWYVCFALYRTTLHASPFFMTLVQKAVQQTEVLKDLIDRRTRGENKSPATIRVGQTTQVTT